MVAQFKATGKRFSSVYGKWFPKCHCKFSFTRVRLIVCTIYYRCYIAYIMYLPPTPSFTSLRIMRLICGWVAPFHPQSVLGTVTPLWIILCRRVFILVVTGLLPLCFVAIRGIVGQVGTARVAPILPLSPWPIGVAHWSTESISMIPVGRCSGVGLALLLETGQRLDLLC